MPRWNAWLCRFGRPGTAMPARCSAPPRACTPATDRDHAVGDRDADVARPARRQQRVVEEQSAQSSATEHFGRLASATFGIRFGIEEVGNEDAMRCDPIWRDARLATLALGRPGLGIVEHGAIAAKDGRIAYVGAAPTAGRRGRGGASPRRPLDHARD